MQQVSSDLLDSLRTGNATAKKYSIVAEFFSSDAEPGENGFDPSSDDCLLALSKTGAGESAITFMGVDYKRLIAKGGIGDIKRTLRKEVSGLSLKLTNFAEDDDSRVVLDFEYDTGFEGLICIIRLLNRDLLDNLEDSIVLFTGRCDKIDTFDKSSLTATVSVKQILNATEILIPRRTFTVDDAQGRPQSDPEFEGFPFSPRGGVVNFDQKVAKTGFFNVLFGRKKTERVSQPWSSHLNNLRDTAVPVVLGRVQLQMLVFASEDLGTQINGMAFIADGHEKGITGITNWRSVTDGFPLAAVAPKNGKVGHSGSVDTTDYQTNDDPTWVAAGIYSRTALMRFVAGGTTLQNDDNAPDIVCLAFGLLVLTPDGDGLFTIYDWTDNPVILTRWILNSEYYFNKSANWFDDPEIIDEAGYCDHVLVDQVNTDTVSLPSSQTLAAGSEYKIYKSTSVLNPDHFDKVSGGLDPGDISPYSQEADYQFYDDIPINGDDPSGTGTPALPATALRRRYTLNLLIKEQTKAFDYLFDTILPTYNGYIVQKANGKFSIRVAKPEDFSFIYASSIVGATEIHVKNVNYWIDNPGLLLIGANLANSEVRRVTDYRYDTSVSITCTASGGISSSGSLGSGTSTVAPHATLTVSSASGTKTVTINGLAVQYTPQSGESTITAAAFIAGTINSNNELNKYIKAIWNPGESTVLVESRIGYLTLDSALEEVHLQSIANPSSAPSLTETSGGSLAAGTYLISYSYVTLEGETLVSTVTSITIAADKKIATPTLTLPSRVIAVNWYVSCEVNGVRRYLHSTKTTGASFYINELPTKDDGTEPVINETAEEVHRIALSITDRGDLFNNLEASNMLKGTLQFPLGSRTPSTNQIKLSYPEASADYAITPLIVKDKAHQLKVKKVNEKEFNGLGIDNYHQARRIANQLLAVWRDGDRFVTVGSDGEALLLEEGDIVCVTDESGRYRNEPVRVEDLTISDGDGYARVSFTGRKYRRSYYNDQVAERLVPLPIVQNNSINREQKAPNIYLFEDTTNTNIKIGVTDYSTAPNYRETWMTADADFDTPANVFIKLQSANNTKGEILDNFVNLERGATGITELDDLTAAVEVMIKSRHSTNNIQFGSWSNTLTVEYQDDLGGGGSTGDDPPPPDEGGGTGGDPPKLPPVLITVYLAAVESTQCDVYLTWYARGGAGTYSIYYNTLTTDANFVTSGLSGSSYTHTGVSRPSFGDADEQRFYYVVQSDVTGNSNDLEVDIPAQT